MSDDKPKTSEFISYYTRPVRNTKRMMKGTRASRTPGKTKGENCQTDPVKKFFFCNVKAYKHPQYAIWHAKAKAMNTGGMKI